MQEIVEVKKVNYNHKKYYYMDSESWRNRIFIDIDNPELFLFQLFRLLKKNEYFFKFDDNLDFNHILKDYILSKFNL